MPVSSKHETYAEMMEYSRETRIPIMGQKAVKSYAKTFLPCSFSDDAERYKAYAERAIFTNFVGATHQGFMGMIFRKPPIFELPTKLQYIEKNINGSGVGLKQFSKDVVDHVSADVVYGLLVDPPKRENSEVSPKISTYSAANIINWETFINENDNLKLSMVVLVENKKIKIDEFETKREKRYRVLILVDGLYFHRIYNEKEEFIDEIPIIGPDGKQLNFIPFIFCGNKDNLPGFNKPAYYDIAVVNIGHFRNSADKEENEHLHGQGTLIFWGDMTVSEFKELNPNGIKVGARGGHYLGSNGGGELLQLEQNQALKQSMEDKEKQMVALGAKFITSKYRYETTEQTSANSSEKSSAINTLVDNVEMAIKQCLEWMCLFLDISPDFSFVMNRDFYDKSLTPQEVSAAIMLNENGITSKTDLRQTVRGSVFLDETRTDDEIDNDLMSENE